MVNTAERTTPSKQQASAETPNTRVLFLLPVVTHVRYRKRMEALTTLNLDIEVLAFERPYYPGKPKINYISLGSISHNNYLKRILPFLKALPKIWRHARKTDVVYCFGLDMLLLAWLVKMLLGKPVTLLYEVGDIREVLLGTKLKSKLARALETFLVKRIDRLILTSEAYYEHFYKGILKLSVAYQVIENKLELGFIEKQALLPPSYRLGYFGVLRCPRSWEIMNQLAKGGMSIYIRGFPRSPLTLNEDNLSSAADNQENLSYGGTYLAPDELTSIYEQVELVWACYPFEENRPVANWKWARTNRFYESCFFKKAMICQAGTEDARVVEALNIGLAVDLSKPEEVIKTLQTISPEQIRIWTENLENLPESIYMYSDEHEVLADFLTQTQTTALAKP